MSFHMPEGKQFTKKQVILLSIGCGFGIVHELFSLFTMEDLAHSRFRALGHVLVCIALVYAICFFIKRRDKGEESHLDKEG